MFATHIASRPDANASCTADLVLPSAELLNNFALEPELFLRRPLHLCRIHNLASPTHRSAAAAHKKEIAGAHLHLWQRGERHFFQVECSPFLPTVRPTCVTGCNDTILPLYIACPVAMHANNRSEALLTLFLSCLSRSAPPAMVPMISCLPCGGCRSESTTFPCEFAALSTILRHSNKHAWVRLDIAPDKPIRVNPV